MAHPVATLFALTMAVWVADVRFAPAVTPIEPAAPTPALAAPVAPAADACVSGPSATAPSDADVEVVVCGTRLK